MDARRKKGKSSGLEQFLFFCHQLRLQEQRDARGASLLMCGLPSDLAHLVPIEELPLRFHSPLHTQDGRSLLPLASLQAARMANNLPLFIPHFKPGLFHMIISFLEAHSEKQFVL